MLLVCTSVNSQCNALALCACQFNYTCGHVIKSIYGAAGCLSHIIQTTSSRNNEEQVIQMHRPVTLPRLAVETFALNSCSRAQARQLAHSKMPVQSQIKYSSKHAELQAEKQMYTTLNHDS